MYTIYCCMLRTQGEEKLPSKLCLMTADKALKSGMWSISFSSRSKKTRSRMDSTACFTLVSNGLMYAHMYRESSVHSIAEQDIEARLGLSQSYYAFTNSVSLIEQVQKVLDLL